MTTPGFRGARPLTDADVEFFRRHREQVNEGINAQVKAQDELIKAEIRRLGHDPDSGEPIPEWITQGIAERLSLGDFHVPLVVKITDEEAP